MNLNAARLNQPLCAMDAQFRIRRFLDLDGREIKLYCRQVKFRAVLGATFRLYEDSRGLNWLEIAIKDQSCLLPATAASFEKQVAEELLTLGLNKYSG